MSTTWRWGRALALMGMIEALACAGGCGSDEPGAGPDTAGTLDGSGPDAPTSDTPVPDTAPPDTGSDALTADTGPDAAPSDTAPDAAGRDTLPDTAGSDTAGSDTAGSDTASTDMGPGAQDAAPPVDAGPVVIDHYSEHGTACNTDADCAIPCAKGQCAAGTCSFIPRPGTCLVEVAGSKVGCYGAGMSGTTSACLSCNPAVAQGALTAIAVLVPLDDDGEGVEIEDLSKGGIIWTLSDKRSVSGGTSLYFGDPKTGLYANDKHVRASATTAELAVPDFAGATPLLSFWLWLSTEESPGYDTLKVEVAGGSGAKAKATQVWQSDSIGGSTHGVWRNIEVGLGPWAGQKVRVRFTFNSVDAFVNAFEGAYVDQLSLKTGCCGSAADCDDGNACSADTCAPGAKGKVPVCAHQPDKACCASAADCDDGKPCTLDICSATGPGQAGTCSHSAKPDCCMGAADCDDHDACTLDRCPKAGAQCQHTNTCCKADSECTSEDPCLEGACTAGECTFQSTCCVDDADCDDFNTCTVDACDASSKCRHTPSTAPGCCSPVPWAEEFEVPLQGWTADPPKNGLLWEQQSYPAGKLKEGTGALKFGLKGKPELGQFKTYGYGYILSPPIQLPAGQDAELEVHGLSDLQTQKGSKPSISNRVYVYARDGAKKNSTLGYLYFNKVGPMTFKKDISVFAGRTFRLRLRGYIYGYSSNWITGSGLLIDSVRVRTTCSPKTCTAGKDCMHFYMSCFKGLCSNGLCTYPNSCCKTNADCKSKDLCQQGSCKYGKCKFTKKTGCCMGDKDCDDGAKCSKDSCSAPGGTCNHAKIAGCTEPFCGDGKCDKDGKETCFSCVKDCGKCVGCGADPANTCYGKCDKYVSGAPCQCDSKCKTFGDCCADLGKCCAP